jgi:hypothetical protein
VAKFF